MGLDAYVKRVRRTDGLAPFSDPVDFQGQLLTDDGDERPGVVIREVAYFRKHHDLQGWAEWLYRKKGGTDEQFNCVPVELTASDLARLRADVSADNLPATSGFFFGSGNTDYHKADTLKMIADAEAAIKGGWRVYYKSWW